MSINRRVFVKSGALALVALGLPPAFVTRSLLAQTTRARKKTIVAIFHRAARSLCPPPRDRRAARST